MLQRTSSIRPLRMAASADPMLRRAVLSLRHLMAVAALFLLAIPGRAAESLPLTEYQMKAAFLYNFMKFVEWPGQSSRDTNSPVVIGVLGEDPFGKDLEAVIEGKRINDRPVGIQRFPPGSSPNLCDVLFIAASERRRLPQLLRSLQNRATLTVGDEIDGFCQMEGMINFVKEAKKVRFQINNKAAERQGLKISSKLLRLGVPIESGAAR